MAEVRVEGLTKAYGATRALDAVSLTFPDGGFFGLLGPVLGKWYRQVVQGRKVFVRSFEYSFD